MSEINHNDLVLQDVLMIFANHAQAVICRAAAEVKAGQVVFSNPVRVTDDVVTAVLEGTRQKTALQLPVLGAHILAQAQDSVAWFVPAQRRKLQFSPNTSGSGLQVMRGKDIPQPPLVMVATPRGHCVWALAENTRPDADTPLFKAPYWNIFPTHYTCLGSMHRPARNTPDTTGEWETSFYESNFTHSCDSGRWPSRWTYLEFLQAAVAAGEFDPSWLSPANLTLGTALGHVAEGRR